MKMQRDHEEMQISGIEVASFVNGKPTKRRLDLNKRILFLAERMAMGFGVSVVIDNLAEELARRGHHVDVGCIHWDRNSSEHYTVHVLDASPAAVHKLASQSNSEYVVAHTSPFFEYLPQLSGPYKRWVWEHGDPTPDLFPFDGPERRRIAENKHINVYPNVDLVVAISEFIRDDIGWPSAKLIHNGCDHLRPAQSSPRDDGKLRVGTLMRLGKGEAYYKGNQLYANLVQRCRNRSKAIDFYLMGRGDKEDAKVFEDLGVITHRNASDLQRAEYLADLDVFVSLSLWEGFNLPLVEAMLSGTFSIAFDTGAHPEVTPLIVSSLSEMESLIFSLDKNRSVLHARAEAAQRFVSRKYRWSLSVDAMLSLM